MRISWDKIRDVNVERRKKRVINYPEVKITQIQRDGRTWEDYPTARNYKIEGTSQESAEAIEPRANLLRAKVLKAIRESEEGLSADQVSVIINETVLSTRPRLSELKDSNLIIDSGKRARNESGRSAVIWRAI